ncbi:MAG TPA: hypothetical protein VFS05_15350 [Gemmatimonadaceae bacterium]|nr:hypothetical protein [Gemmatimonadaceae bacterium]
MAESSERVADVLQAEASAIIRAVRHAPPPRLHDAMEVREAVVRYGARARAAGIAPQQLVVRLKRLLRSAALGELSDCHRAALIDDAIGSVIAGFYDGASDRP